MVAPPLFPSSLFAQAVSPGVWGRIYLEQLLGDLIPFLVFSGGLYLVFYVLLPRALSHRKIQAAFPIPADVRRELLLSLQSIAIFAATGVLFFELTRLGWTRLYTRIDAYGWGYFCFSVFLLIFIQDAWFYWTHRFLHWAPIFRWVHHVHHRCHNPTPWGALAFHPLESFINVLIFPLVMIFIPIHPWAGLIWLLYMFFMTAYGHLGFETMPQGFTRHWLFRWYTTSTHHNVHHTHIRTNYGLYFTIWDRLMHTTSEDYEKTFEQVARAPKLSKRDFRRRRRADARKLASQPGGS